MIPPRTEEPVKVGTCARDRRALQQLALSVTLALTLTWCSFRFELRLEWVMILMRWVCICNHTPYMVAFKKHLCCKIAIILIE